jgi:hypothetical protein
MHGLKNDFNNECKESRLILCEISPPKKTNKKREKKNQKQKQTNKQTNKKKRRKEIKSVLV